VAGGIKKVRAQQYMKRCSDRGDGVEEKGTDTERGIMTEERLNQQQLGGGKIEKKQFGKNPAEERTPSTPFHTPPEYPPGGAQ